ncbi:MAG: aromatic amino acid transport family protein [Candidatus Woesearchaeota archaeon]
MSKSYWQASATLVGMIIGAGILGIPYVVAKSGYLLGALNIIILGIAILFINLYTGEISLRTRGIHQVTGYASLYLGKWGKLLMLISIITVGISALAAYLIGISKALNAVFGVREIFFVLAAFIVLGLLIYRGLKIIQEWELALGIVMLLVIVVIALLSLNKIDASNLSSFNFPLILAPYGVVFFAFLGYAAVPELKEILRKERKRVKSAIIVGSIIPIFIYLLFVAVVVSVTGTSTSDVASLGLGEAIGLHMIVLGNLLAVFTMSTSFLAVGLAVKWVFQYDYGMNEKLSVALTCILPLAIVLGGITNFIQAIEIGGSVGGGVGGILLVLIFHRAKKLGERKPEFSLNVHWIFSALLVAIFVGGILYTLLTLVR